MLPRPIEQRPRKMRCPPRALFDGTGDEELHARFFEMNVTRLCAEVDPPPKTRHLAVRTGKRYGKTSLTAQHGRDLARAIAECRYLLRELDPDGTLAASGRVGLITFKDCERASPVRWASRRTAPVISRVCTGAMRRHDYDVLLVVGTPAVRPEQVARLACASYFEDPPGSSMRVSERDALGVWRYRDPRMRAEWPTHSYARNSTRVRACNRPLRYVGRVVVTLRADEVLYLPVTRRAPACRS